MKVQVAHGELQESILRITADHCLEQLVGFPTRRHHNRTENILDLCFTTRPSLADSTGPHPGLADHDFVVAKFCLKAPLPRKPPREVYKWGKVDETIFKRQVKELATHGQLT